MIRFPDGMRDALKASAASNSRSMNAEIIHRLKQEGPAEGAASPSHGPSRLSQEIEGMNTATDSTAGAQPATGTTNSDWRDLESVICDTANYAAVMMHMLDKLWQDGHVTDDGGSTLRFMKWEVELVIFMMGKAKDAADRARDDFYAAIEASA